MVISLLLVVMVLAVSIAYAWRHYQCGLRRECSTSAFGIRLTYPYGWHPRMETSLVDGGKKSALLITNATNKGFLIGLIPTIPIPTNQTGVSDYCKLIYATPISHIPNAWAVQFVDETVATEPSTDIVSEAFTVGEEVMSTRQYHELGLTTTSYKLIPPTSQEFHFQPRGAQGGSYMMGAFNQTPAGSERLARAWLSKPEAKIGHDILLSARVEG